MKRILLSSVVMLLALVLLGANSCEREKKVDDPELRDGIVCPLNPSGEPQDFGVRVSAIGEVCVEIDDEISCGARRNLDQINSEVAGCFTFQDGEQNNLKITIEGECFEELVVPSADMTEDNPYDVDLILASAVECWEAEDRFFYPVCSQYLPGNDPRVIAVDACCGACGGACDDPLDCQTYCTDPYDPSSCSMYCEPNPDCDGSTTMAPPGCCDNCETAILPPGVALDTLRLGDPEKFMKCCADYEIRTHQPNEACGDAGRSQ